MWSRPWEQAGARERSFSAPWCHPLSQRSSSSCAATIMQCTYVVHAEYPGMSPARCFLRGWAAQHVLLHKVVCNWAYFYWNMGAMCACASITCCDCAASSGQGCSNCLCHPAWWSCATQRGFVTCWGKRCAQQGNDSGEHQVWNF